MTEPRRNREIKVKVDRLDSYYERALLGGARDCGEHYQRDWYFRVATGRLKLRERPGHDCAELIAYERADELGSRDSHYRIAQVDRPDEVRMVLGAALGILAIVSKSRRLLLHGATRIHLDRVDGLGCFVELETVIDGQSESEAAAEHEWVKQALGLDQGEAIPVSYVDLLMAQRGTSRELDP